MRYEGGLRYAVLGVVSRNTDGVHGWEIKKQFEKLLGTFWQVNLGEVYRILDLFADKGFIEQAFCEVGSNKKVYRITEKGQRNLDDFLLAPPTDAPRPLRAELAVKLQFATSARLPELLKLIDHQREVYMQQLSSLQIQRRKLARLKSDSFVTNLLIEGAELIARAELAWLDEVTVKLKERFAGSA